MYSNTKQLRLTHLYAFVSFLLALDLLRAAYACYVPYTMFGSIRQVQRVGHANLVVAFAMSVVSVCILAIPPVLTGVFGRSAFRMRMMVVGITCEGATLFLDATSMMLTMQFGLCMMAMPLKLAALVAMLYLLYELSTSKTKVPDEDWNETDRKMIPLYSVPLSIIPIYGQYVLHSMKRISGFKD